LKNSTILTKTLESRKYDIFDKCIVPNKSHELKANGIWPYFHTIYESDGPEVMMDGRPIIMAGSNNYLGLAGHPSVKEAAIKAIEKYGTSCSGSRFLTGTIDLHLELEHKIAKFMGKESCLLFSTGYQTSQGVIQPLVGRGDYILSDKDNHSSIVAGNMLAKGMMNSNVVRFKHNDPEDLEKQLTRIPAGAKKILVTDGVFSGNGTTVKLDQLYDVACHYDTPIMVDDAHAFGVIGEGGRGTASHFGIEDDIPVTFCTFSKTLASIGGFVVGDKTTTDYLKHHSPALVFSASPSPASTASAMAALDILIEQPQLVEKLNYNANFLRTNLKQLGFNVPDGNTAIIPIYAEEAIGMKLWKEMYDRNIFVNIFIPPATPPGTTLIRNSMMASHDQNHLDYIVDSYAYVGKQLGMI
jgi:8-amino-7-oxononanoate synthase